MVINLPLYQKKLINMKTGQNLWTREELLLAINLYCKLPFGKLHQRHPEVIALSKLITRTPGSVAFKLVNFASLDPSLKARGIKGASNASKLDKAVWDEFYSNWDNLFVLSEELMAIKKNISIEELNEMPADDLLREGKERERIVKTRLNQYIFRRIVLANYNDMCCITGIDEPGLLIASHILPWSIDLNNRLNPQNGLALNGLHDRAFELGYLTITPEYKIRISSILKKKKSIPSIKENFLAYEDKEILLPKKFKPNPLFLKEHNKRFIP
jgi:putative restriction endonuclease